MIKLPIDEAAVPIAGANAIERPEPITIVTNGVTKISIGVSFETNLPHSAAMIAIIKTANGPPAAPNVFAALPTAASENNTSGGQCVQNL